VPLRRIDADRDTHEPLIEAFVPEAAMDQRLDRSLANARWLVGSGFAIVLGIAIDAPAGAEEGETATAAATTVENSTDTATAQESATKSQDGARGARAKDKKGNKEKDNNPSELLALSTAVTDQPDVICKNLRITGSTIKKRVCGTPEQWEEARKKKSDAAQEGMRQMRDQSTVVSRPADYPQPPGGPSR
jgi:hypothetical protein